MEIPMLESILQTKCMDLEFIILPMGIGMRVHGMREESKVLECIHLGVGRQSGHWHCGMLKTPSTDNSRTGSPKGGIHSKVLIAVQEARRAAGKAFEVPRVDDRVNKVIAAANRAATAARVAAVKAVQKRMDGNVPAVDV